MLEFKRGFTHVGYFSENDRTFYNLYRNDVTGELVMESDDTGTLHLVSELAGTDDMVAVKDDMGLDKLIAACAKDMLRGAILLTSGDVIAIYSLDGEYCYGVNSVYNLYHSIFPSKVFMVNFDADYEIE